MKNNHKKDWKPEIIYNLFFLSEVPLLSHCYLSFFFFFFLRVFIHDMFNFIRHSPFLCFDKRQKITYVHTYIYIYLYIDIYKIKNHSSIKIQTARFMYIIILIIDVIRLVPTISPDPQQCAKAERDPGQLKTAYHRVIKLV